MTDIELPKTLIPEHRADDWYLLRVRPTYEDIAAEFLSKRVRGAQVYYPKSKRQRLVTPPRASREVQVIEGPAIIGYVFARFPAEWPEWTRIETFCSAQPRFIMRISADGETNTTIYVRQHHVETIMLQEQKGAYDSMLVNPLDGLLVGQRVRIPSGPCMGHCGKIKCITEEIVKVSVKMLGKAVYVSLPVDDILEHLA
jgi:transcription antitermination factor NusG